MCCSVCQARDGAVTGQTRRNLATQFDKQQGKHTQHAEYCLSLGGTNFILPKVNQQKLHEITLNIFSFGIKDLSPYI